MLTKEFIEDHFPQIKTMDRITYLDSGATNLKHRDVINTIHTYYAKEAASVHRGIHTLSEHNTDLYEQTRVKLQNFLNAKYREEIIYTKGTTESINLVARTWGEENITQGDEIIISTLEHHSNIVPWQMLCERKNAILKVIPINDKGEILIDEFYKLISSKTKLVAINYVSNALGTINPIEDIIKFTHQNSSAKVLIDAAQAASHLKIDVQALNCDFLALSAHKMFGPTGVGALYGKKDILENTSPLYGGGDMIDKVSFEKTTYNVLPQKFEAGTPHISGVIGWAPALDFISNLGFQAIQEHEHELLVYATEKMSTLSGLKIIGTAEHKSAIISFVIDGMHAHDIATLANKYGLALRTGHHCTQPLMERMNVPATARASFAIYNTKDDVDKLCDSLSKIIMMFN